MRFKPIFRGTENAECPMSKEQLVLQHRFGCELAFEIEFDSLGCAEDLGAVVVELALPM